MPLRMPACRPLSLFSLLVALGAVAPGCQSRPEDLSSLLASTEALEDEAGTPCSDGSDCGANGWCDPNQGICDYPPCSEYACDATSVAQVPGGPTCCSLDIGQMEAMMCKQYAQQVIPLDRWCRPAPVPPPTQRYVCFCKTPGVVGDLLCVNGNWTCVPSAISSSGWATSCTGASSTQSDTDRGGQACNGNAHSGFPGQCPNLTNTPQNGTWQCFENFVADAGTRADAGMK